MTIFHALLLGIIQGLTEFLPISSSGHLVLFERWLDLPVADDHVFDVVLHAGTLVALLVYFRKDWVRLVRSLFIPERAALAEIKFLIIGTIPAAIVGILFASQIDSVFRQEHWVGIWMIVTGCLLLLAERLGSQNKPNASTTALGIGLMQALALIPGVSRSGSTITGGMLLGMRRSDAARFSFLLGTPAIAGATAITIRQLSNEALRVTSAQPYIIGFFVSAVVSFFAIKWLLNFIKTHRLSIFSWYLFIVGGGIVVSFVVGR